MFPDEIWLVFLKNALKNWLPWCCTADEIPHWLPLSSNNGLLFILSFRLPHLNILWKEGRYGPGGRREVRPSLSLMGLCCSWEGLSGEGRGAWASARRDFPDTWPLGGWKSRKKPPHTQFMGGSFRIWIRILLYFGQIGVWQTELSLF